MAEINYLYDIVKKINSLHENDSYKISCGFSNGEDCTLILITFYNSNSRAVGHITFQEETGKICRYNYKNLRFSNTESVVDLLLDIYNYEKQKCLQIN
jgi:hypothetical protein